MHKPEIMILSVCLSNGMHEENYDVFFFLQPTLIYLIRS